MFNYGITTANGQGFIIESELDIQKFIHYLKENELPILKLRNYDSWTENGIPNSIKFMYMIVRFADIKTIEFVEYEE